MDFKTGKISEIVREFLAEGSNRFEINGVDLSKAVFMYRERNSNFIPIPKGNYTITTSENNQFLNIDNEIKAKAYEYQIIYFSDMKAGKYFNEYPELKILVGKYNDLVDDVIEIIKHLKTSGTKIDSLKMSQVLTHLEPNTFWVMNSNEQLEAFPLGDLNSKYIEMVNTLKKEVEELIQRTKDTSISEMQNNLSDKLNDLNTLSDSLKQSLSSAVSKFVSDNRDRLKGDRGAGITSISATGDKVTVNYDDSQSRDFTIPTIAGRDGKEIQNLSYIDNKLKITMSDNSSKEVEIKSSGGIKVRKVFEGELSDGVKVSLSEKWKICVITYIKDQELKEVTLCNYDKKISQPIYTGDLRLEFFVDNNEFHFENGEWRPYLINKIFVVE